MSNNMAIYPRKSILRVVDTEIIAHAALPFIHPHRRMPPQKYEYLPTKVWDLTLSPGTPKGMCFDGRTIYFQQYGASPNFFEVDIITGAITDRSHPTESSEILNLIFDGTYIWMCRSANPTQLKRLKIVHPAGAGAEFWVDGVKVYTATTRIPADTFNAQILLHAIVKNTGAGNWLGLFFSHYHYWQEA